MGQLGDGLTEREQTVMQMLAAGMTEKAIASVLDVNLSTVARLAISIKEKLGAQTTVQAMHIWTIKSPLMERLLAQLKSLQ